MKRAFRDAWVAKLRSGEVVQGENRLCNDNKRCCLGVAYMIDNAGETESFIHNTKIVKFENEEESTTTMPSKNALDTWGLTLKDARILAYMNDGGNSFNVIADWIEQNISVED